VHQKTKVGPDEVVFPIGVAKIILKGYADGPSEVSVNWDPPAKLPKLAVIPGFGEWGTVTLAFTATPIEGEAAPAE
jgi:hypothetical protein